MGKFVSLEEMRQKCKDNNLIDEIKKLLANIEDLDNAVNGKEIEKVILQVRKLIETVLDGKRAKPEHIKQYIEELGKNLPTDEKIIDSVEGKKDVVYLNKKDLEKIEFTKDKIDEHEKIISILKDKIESLQEKLNANTKELTKENHLSQIPALNELLNSSDEKITVAINKDLLSKATKFIDEHSLIKLESIIKDGYDLNSTIVQSILLAFIHQNSLL